MLLKRRLQFITIAIACFSVFLASTFIGWQTYSSSSEIIRKNKIDQLISIRDIKAESIRRYFKTITTQVGLYAGDQMVINATREFVKGYNNYLTDIGDYRDKYKVGSVNRYMKDFSNTYKTRNGGRATDPRKLINLDNDTSFALQYNYIIENPFEAVNKSQLDYAHDGSKYSKTHKKYHTRFRQIVNSDFNFHDMFIVDAATGNIVYTVKKELDFTTSLIDGPYANTAIGRVFKRARIAPVEGYITLSDFSNYLPSYDDQAAFIASPIFDDFDRKIGVLIFQLSIYKINKIMSDNKEWKDIGLGDTGESYLVGSDFKMRSVSRWLVEDENAYLEKMQELGVNENNLSLIKAKHTSIGLQAVNSMGAKAVIAGRTGFDEYTSYKGTKVYGAYEPLGIRGLDWGIMSEIEVDEALHSLNKLLWIIIGTVVVITLLVCVVASFIATIVARQISDPVDKFCNSMKDIAVSKDLTKRVYLDSNYNEMISLTTAVNALLANMQEYFQNTVNSTYKMQSAAEKIMGVADMYHAPEQMEQQNYQHPEYNPETSSELKETGANLSELSSRLQDLSRQFKLFEDENDRTSGW